MKVTNEKFKDTTYEKVLKVHEMLVFLYSENAQVYGALAKLMLDTGTDEFELTIEDRQSIHDNYSVHFTKANQDDEEDQTAKVTLVKHEYEESDGN